MSEEGDLLSQWRAYADGGAGVSIGFEREYFEELGATKRDRNDDFNASLTKIEYDPGKQREIVAEHLDDILRLVSEGALQRPTLLTSEDEAKRCQDKFRSMCLRFMFFIFPLFTLKSPAFVEEREWRIISHLVRDPKSGEMDVISNMEFRALSDRIVPFVRIKLEPLAHRSITDVVLGPKNITPVEIVSGLLRKHGWGDITVRRSRATLR